MISISHCFWKHKSSVSSYGIREPAITASNVCGKVHILMLSDSNIPELTVADIKVITKTFRTQYALLSLCQGLLQLELPIISIVRGCSPDLKCIIR